MLPNNRVAMPSFANVMLKFDSSSRSVSNSSSNMGSQQVMI